MQIFVARNQAPARGRSFWFYLYNGFALPVLVFLARLVAALPFSSRRTAKIRAGVTGRQNLISVLSHQLHACGTGPRVWVHASSMGECEQAQPILRLLHEVFPDSVRILTVFSPSAHAHISRRRLPAEVFGYLPFDSLSLVRRFFDEVKAVAGVFIRHDLWPNFLWEARQRGTLLLLADASVSANARSFRHTFGVRHFNREIFAAFDWICAVSSAAAADLQNIVRYPQRLRVTGDTRYDQVLFRTRSVDWRQLLPQPWRTCAQLLVAGSTWPSDEEVLIPAFATARERFPAARMILVPHEPTASHLSNAEELLAHYRLRSCRLSNPEAPPAAEVMLVDRVGVLAELYGAGSVAFVGGGFGPGVHSVLEAAAHGVPVLCGPRMHNSAEALSMREQGIGKIVTNLEDGAQLLLHLFADPTAAQAWGAACRDFVERQAGAARAIVDLLQPALII